MAERTTGAIALRPTGNAQGGYFFFSLTTGRVFNRNNWTVLPIPNEVIERVETMAKNNVGLEFLDSEGNEIVDDEESYTDEAEDDQSLGSITGVDEQEVNDIQQDEVPQLQQQRIDPPSSDEESAVDSAEEEASSSDENSAVDSTEEEVASSVDDTDAQPMPTILTDRQKMSMAPNHGKKRKQRRTTVDSYMNRIS